MWQQHYPEGLSVYDAYTSSVERADATPDCLFEGHHANMNCSQPTWTPRTRRNASLIGAPTAAGKPDLRPSVTWGCKPFDNACGTTGRRLQANLADADWD